MKIATKWMSALTLLAAHAVTATPPENPASWPRWLEASEPLFIFSSRALEPAPDALVPAVTGNSDATQSVLAWTQQSLQLIRKYQQNPLRAARALALLHAAMHDAFVLAARDADSTGSGLVAAHRAAGITLAYLYPYEPATWIEGKALALSQAWAHTLRLDAARLERALVAGERAANDAIQRALTDDADRRPAARTAAAGAPGRWRATPPLNIHTPQELLAGEWRAWVRGSNELQPPPPPEYGSARFWAETEEVYRVWQILTSKQKAIAEDWNLDAGSITPPGVWNQRAVELIRSRKLDPAAAVRILAALNTAMHDAAIACWRAKYRWWLVRPVTVIRERFDPGFLPHIITPPHPSYVSGHASISGAAEVVLAAFFPDRKSELQALAEEAALSRLYGGIHYRSDNDEGLRLGRKVGELVVRRTVASENPSNQRGPGKKP